MLNYMLNSEYIYLINKMIKSWKLFRFYSLRKRTYVPLHVFSSAVPTGSGAFQMPTRPSSSSASSASTLRGGGGEEPISETLQ